MDNSAHRLASQGSTVLWPEFPSGSDPDVQTRAFPQALTAAAQHAAPTCPWGTTLT